MGSFFFGEKRREKREKRREEMEKRGRMKNYQ